MARGGCRDPPRRRAVIGGRGHGQTRGGSAEPLSADSGAASTRARAGEWIDANIPAGASVGLTRYPAPSYTPSFRFDRHKPCYLNPPAARARRRPDWIVVDLPVGAK